jgi:hypothetical protein
METTSSKALEQEQSFEGKFPFEAVEYESITRTATPKIILNGYNWRLDTDLLPTTDGHSTDGLLWSNGGIICLNSFALPTTDPGHTGRLWSSGGAVVQSGYTPPAHDGVPVGVFFPYAGSTAPTGYLLFAPGATIGDLSSTATYKSASYEALFNICKASWGNAGTETWASHDKVLLPDPTAASLVGVGTSTGFTTNETIAQGVKVNDQLQGHNQGKGLIDTASGVSKVHDPNGHADWSGKGSVSGSANTAANTFYRADGSNGTPRIGTTTHGKYLGTYYIIKY